jgi:hypothetical protein
MLKLLLGRVKIFIEGQVNRGPPTFNADNQQKKCEWDEYIFDGRAKVRSGYFNEDTQAAALGAAIKLSGKLELGWLYSKFKGRADDELTFSFNQPAIDCQGFTYGQPAHVWPSSRRHPGPVPAR